MQGPTTAQLILAKLKYEEVSVTVSPERVRVLPWFRHKDAKTACLRGKGLPPPGFTLCEARLEEILGVFPKTKIHI